MKEYTVKQGDCIESIAFQHGLFWEAIWNDPHNRELRSVRKEHNLLKAGDKVFISDLRLRQESGSTGLRHRFKRKGVPSKLQLRLLFDGQSRANVPYVLRVDGDLCSGTTDEEGYLEEAISPNAREASVILIEGSETEEYAIDLGYLDPDSELTGIQSRLANLGFTCSPTGRLDETTETALQTFQRVYGLKVIGQLDESTRKKILEVHDIKLGEPPSKSGATMSEM